MDYGMYVDNGQFAGDILLDALPSPPPLNTEKVFLNMWQERQRNIILFDKI